jgi:outer membrane protein assembly factor BamB
MPRLLALVVVVLLGCLALAQPQPATVTPATDVPLFSEAIALPTDPALRKKFQAIDDYTHDQSWAPVTRLLQAFLDAPEDQFVPLARSEGGQMRLVWASVRSEAQRLLEALPRAGRDFYETTYGSLAKKALDEARQRHNHEALERVVQRYLWTKAGVEALELLSLYHLDRGRAGVAALCYERLIQRVGLDALPPATLFQATLAFAAAGEREQTEKLRKALAARAPEGLFASGRRVPLADLEKQIARRAERRPAETPAVAVAAEPALQQGWTRSLHPAEQTRAWMTLARIAQESRPQPVVPAARPLVVGDVCVYRDTAGLAAVDLATGKPRWQAASPSSLAGLARDDRNAPHLLAWLETFQEVHPQILLENSLLGSLTSDGVRLFAVDDLAILPCVLNDRRLDVQNARFDGAPQLTEAVHYNHLQAFDAPTGRLLWQHGGHPPKESEPALADTHFLATPLLASGGLFTLAEKNGDLSLVCLEPATGALVWTQKLAAPGRRLLLDGGRRLHAAQLVARDGVLLCITNSGAVIAVDLLARTFLWAQVYRDKATPAGSKLRGLRPLRDQLLTSLPLLRSVWQVTTPVLHGDTMIFTAPDAPGLFCLRLRDGAILWQSPRSTQDLYFAGVVAGKALIVGRQECRALDPATGAEVWKLETDWPSGRGIASGDLYHLPVKPRGEEAGGALWTIDAAKGEVLRRVKLPKPEVLGNLVAASQGVLSQTTDGVSLYPEK